MFLYRVSERFSLDSDVVHFCCMKSWYFLLVAAQSPRFSPDLSRSGSGERGLGAAGSGRTCHLASSLPDETLCVCVVQLPLRGT